jgi:hypothetical protein
MALLNQVVDIFNLPLERTLIAHGRLGKEFFTSENSLPA